MAESVIESARHSGPGLLCPTFEAGAAATQRTSAMATCRIIPLPRETRYGYQEHCFVLKGMAGGPAYAVEWPNLSILSKQTGELLDQVDAE